MNKDAKIAVFGGSGLVGSSIINELKNQGYNNIQSPSHKELDLTRQTETLNFFSNNKPEFVFNAAAVVGGIVANDTYRADFIFKNLQIQNNVFEGCFKNQIKRLIFLGSSCIYPKLCPQPIKEEYLLTGPLEYTNEPYAIAKIAGLKTAENFRKQYGCDYISVMPTNLYGPNDKFDAQNSHVIPGLITRLTETIKKGETVFAVWGTGNPKREFLFAPDLARACVFLMNYQGKLPDWINVGFGEDIEIGELAKLISRLMGYKGTIIFDKSVPDGTPRKFLDASKVFALGWRPTVGLEEGIRQVLESRGLLNMGGK